METYWIDPSMLRHGDGTTVSFADGHAEYYKYKDPRSLELGEWDLAGQYWSRGGRNVEQRNNEDLQWMQKTCWGHLHPNAQ